MSHSSVHLKDSLIQLGVHYVIMYRGAIRKWKRAFVRVDGKGYMYVLMCYMYIRGTYFHGAVVVFVVITGCS